jgi:glycosyltransferase involved in cell wall biosynthesis
MSTTALKNILFISYDGMTDPLGQSQVLPYLQGLSLYGYNIFLLSCEKKEAFAKNKSLVNKIIEGYNIKWITLPYTKKPPVLSTVIDIYKLKKAAKQIQLQHKIDMVHTRPGIPALVGLWMKNKLGVKFLNDIREFYADSRVEGGMWNKKNYLYKKVYTYFKKQEAEQVKKSDGIVCLTYAAEKIIQQWPEYDAKIPLKVIPCSVDIDLFNPDNLEKNLVQQFKTPLKINKDDLIISYLGSIGGWYLTAEMMEFCKLLSEKIPAAKFLFISPHRHDQIIQTAAKFNLQADKIITVQAKRNEVPALLSLSKYSLFFIKPCYSKLSSSPTKHGEIMAMGIPVITNSGVGDVSNIVEKYNAGFIVNDFSEQSFISVVNAISENNNFDFKNIRQGAVEFYALKNAVLSYIDIYNKILNT